MKTLACVVFELEEGERIEDLIEELNEISAIRKSKTGVQLARWKQELQEILSKLHISANCGGYNLLFCAVEIAAKNPRVFMNDIYAEIANSCNKDESKIEGQIRYIIDKIVQFNNPERINSVLGIPADTSIKFTPSGVIKHLASMLF